MDPETKAMLEKIYISTEKTRKYLLWTFIITAVAVLLPLVGLLFAIPVLLSNLNAVVGL